MDNISEITRQEILDVIKDGVVVTLSQPTYDNDVGGYVTERRVRIPYYGRLDEITFLERLYDLKELPSKDRRYRSAYEDISCHLHFGDYEDDCWFFCDDRFNLRHGDGDETLLRFLCAMLDPVVRNEKSEWKRYLDKFNELLCPDGYELYPAQRISGRDVYGARKCKESQQTRFPDSLFSERYKELIEYGQGQERDHISGAVDFNAKRHICKIMLEFKQPVSHPVDRYDSRTENTDALEQAVQRLNEFLGIPVANLQALKIHPHTECEALTDLCIPFLFDIIEFQYDKLSFSEKADFQEKINESFQRDHVPFRLNDSGLIEQLTSQEVLTSDIVALGMKIREPGLKDMFELAIEKHMQPNLQAHKDAVEKLWDVFERLKTYYTDLEKKRSAEKIIEDMACGQEAYKELFDKEFKELSRIGNEFRIRHHETDKIDILDMRCYDYFFNRCLSLIALALQYLK